MAGRTTTEHNASRRHIVGSRGIINTGTRLHTFLRRLSLSVMSRYFNGSVGLLKPYKSVSNVWRQL